MLEPLRGLPEAEVGVGLGDVHHRDDRDGDQHEYGGRRSGHRSGQAAPPAAVEDGPGTTVVVEPRQGERHVVQASAREDRQGRDHWQEVVEGLEWIGLEEHAEHEHPSQQQPVAGGSNPQRHDQPERPDRKDRIAAEVPQLAEVVVPCDLGDPRAAVMEERYELVRIRENLDDRRRQERHEDQRRQPDVAPFQPPQLPREKQVEQGDHEHQNARDLRLRGE